MSNIIRAIYFAIWFIVVLISYALLGVLPALAHALWFAAFYLLITLPVRSLRVLAFAVFFFIGLLIVSHATLLSQVVLGHWHRAECVRRYVPCERNRRDARHRHEYSSALD